jgi:hypothetical protein
MEILKKIIQTFAYIATGSLISAALFITIFIPKEKLEVTLLWEIIVIAAVCSLGNFIFYYKKMLTKKQMKNVKLDRRKGAVIAIDINKMQAIEEMKDDLRVILAKAICKNISCEEAHKIVDQIFDEFERG